jgi:hypothetical protein
MITLPWDRTQRSAGSEHRFGNHMSRCPYNSGAYPDPVASVPSVMVALNWGNVRLGTI